MKFVSFIKDKKLFVGSLLHSFLLVFLTFFVLNSTFVHWDEEELVWVNNFIKKFVFQFDEKPNTNNFIFINVAYDNQLINKYDKNGFVLGNQDITDREKLTKFFSIIKKTPSYKYMFCDIQFSEKSSSDSLLASSFKGVNNFISSTHTIPYKSLFDIPLALSKYDNDGNFLKYRYIEKEKYKSTPLVIYEYLNKTKGEKFFNLLKIDNRYFLNYGILDMKIRDFDIKKHQSVQDSSHFHMKYMHLGEMLLMDSLLQGNYICNEVKDRIIILGDFEDRDIHDTVVGNIPGPVILLNAYLALKYGDNEITLLLLLFLGSAYFVLSMIIFSSNEFTKDKIKLWIPSLIKFQFLIEFIGYFLFLFIVSLLCYLLFNVQISIIFIAVYVKVIDWVLENFFFNRKKLETK